MIVINIAISGSISILSAIVLVPIGKALWVNDINGFFVKTLGPYLYGIDVKIIEGKEHLQHTKPSVYLLNHQSTMDMHILGAVLPHRVVLTAKKEIMFIPIMGQVFMAGKNMFIDRKNRASAVAAMDTVQSRMIKENLSVLIFPEGTRSHQSDKSLLPFKKGAFHMAVKGKFPIIPIVASTLAPIYNEKTKLFENGTVQVKGALF
jgi:lysophosphatidate acyltransferase